MTSDSFLRPRNYPSSKIYRGYLNDKAKTAASKRPVTVNGRPLPSAQDISDDSPTGFEWGYGGAGPHQLALALTADLYGKENTIRNGQYTPMVGAMLELVKSLPNNEEWILTDEEIHLHMETTEGKCVMDQRGHLNRNLCVTAHEHNRADSQTSDIPGSD